MAKHGVIGRRKKGGNAIFILPRESKKCPQSAALVLNVGQVDPGSEAYTRVLRRLIGPQERIPLQNRALRRPGNEIFQAEIKNIEVCPLPE